MKYTRDDIIAMLVEGDDSELFGQADRVRRELVGDELQVRAIIEISNYCRCGCTYCGLRAADTDVPRYRIPEKEIIELARVASEVGFRTIVLQSGEDEYFSGRRVTELVRAIKEETDCAITLSLGEWPEEQFREWYEAGADRYLLKHETMNPDLYARMHPRGQQKTRLQALWALRETGYQVGSGCMVGLPGQTAGDLADDILFCRELEVDMAGFGPFISHPGTPLSGYPNGDKDLSLRVLAAARLVLGVAHLPATTSLVVLDSEYRRKALLSGANVIMPDITPAKYRNLYNIYPGKGEGDDHIDHVRHAFEFAQGVAREVGWRVATHHGHSYRDRFKNVSGR
ncbi:MAG: [FeFe] hydrogenase H-cluster radical SAM maturase HydE [Planctomycetota bacterium]|nr:[FeFe] hydrogenase H-cluster radical SAM maturase HydE [Planctomycetota bacterium]